MLADSLLMIATSTYPFDQERIARGTTIWDAGLAMAEPAYEWRWIYLTRGHLASARAARSDDGGQRAYWEALCWFETALAADPQRTSIWTRIAEAANLGYLYEYGIDALEGAIALAPTDVAAIAEHAALLVNTGRVSAALAAVSAARALGDLAGSDTYIDKIESFCHVLQRNYADALALVEQALVIAPTDQWSLFTRFWIRRQLRLDGAEDDLALIEQALALDPDNHRAHANLLVMRGRFDEALARLDQLAAVDDLALQDPNVLGTKLTCLAALGRAEHRAVLDSVVQLSRYAPEVSSVVDHSIPWALEQVSDQVARSMLVQAGVELAALVSRLSAGRTLDDDLMTLDHEASQSIERGSWGRLLGTMIGARRSGWITPDLTDVRADLPLAGQVLCDRYVGLVGLAATLANPGDTMAGQDAAAQDPAAQDPAARDASGTAPSTPDASGTA
jgi:tetratricopeptide (TPR) repeat protein